MELAKENREILLAIAEQFTATDTKLTFMVGMDKEGMPSLVLGDGITYSDFLKIGIKLMKLVVDKIESGEINGDGIPTPPPLPESSKN